MARDRTHWLKAHHKAVIRSVFKFVVCISDANVLQIQICREFIERPVRLTLLLSTCAPRHLSRKRVSSRGCYVVPYKHVRACLKVNILFKRLVFVVNVEVSTPVSYSGGPGFLSRPGVQLSRLTFFLIFLSPSTKIPGQSLKLGHGRFLPHPLQFVIHLSAFH
jgi:hypothetical protein